MIRPVVLASALLLGGCFPDPEGQMAACRIEAQRAYPGEDFNFHDPINELVRDCMKAGGYDFMQDCRRFPYAASANCYRRR